MKIEEVLKIIDQVRQEHPYKVPGRQETYDPYNEGWEDACCKIEAIISGMQGEDEKKYACKYCASIQEAIDKLAEYEDTGLTPEEINKLKENYGYWRSEALKGGENYVGDSN